MNSVMTGTQARDSPREQPLLEALIFTLFQLFWICTVSLIFGKKVPHSWRSFFCGEKKKYKKSSPPLKSSSCHVFSWKNYLHQWQQQYHTSQRACKLQFTATRTVTGWRFKTIKITEDLLKSSCCSGQSISHPGDGDSILHSLLVQLTSPNKRDFQQQQYILF